MNHDELKSRLAEQDTSLTFEEGGELLTVNVEVANWKTLARYLQHEQALSFDFLGFCTCIDWKTHLTMIYQLDSYTHAHNLMVQVKLPADNPVVDTVSDLWQTAIFHEREVYELFGVTFTGHPDLRLLILPDGWEGKNPLRKDFDDPVNMIRL